jgi:broad specificity phosphatase PhoE
MTEFYLARHPESIFNVDAVKVGGRSNEIPITERGATQARLFSAAFHLKYPAPTVLFSSPAIRARALMDTYVETSQTTLEYALDDDLQEMGHGLVEGLHRDDVYTPPVLALIEANPFGFKHAEGESLTEVSERVLGWMKRVENDHPDGIVLATTHGQAIRTAVGFLLDWSRYQITLDPEKKAANVSLTHLSTYDGEITVNYYAKGIIPESITDTRI